MKKPIQPAEGPFDICEALFRTSEALKLIEIARWLIEEMDTPGKAWFLLEQAQPKLEVAIAQLLKGSGVCPETLEDDDFRGRSDVS